MKDDSEQTFWEKEKMVTRVRIHQSFLRTFSVGFYSEACEKSSRWFWKVHDVSIVVSKPGNAYASLTAMI